VGKVSMSYGHVGKVQTGVVLDIGATEIE